MSAMQQASWYGSSKTPDEKIIAELEQRGEGIQRYISAPETPVTLVDDQGGNPMATQPENRDDAMYPSNMSSEAAKDDQNAIDARLKAGRDRREKADTPDDIGSTKLNPDGSDKDNVADKRQPKKASGPSK